MNTKVSHRSKVKVTWVLFLFLACIVLLEAVGLDLRRVMMSFARWRHYFCRRMQLVLDVGSTLP